jgi:hypothetical protein
MDHFSLHSVIAKNEEIVTADMDGETVMMSIEMGKYYSLGKTGSVIWSMIDTPLSIEELIEKLMGKYNAGREQCEKDVLSFLGEMLEEGIITIQ